MKVHSLVTNNFRGAKGAASYAFGPCVEITGDNFQGKTTIRDAIIYGLHGVTATGSNRVDHFIHQGCKKMMAALRFTGIDGQEHEVTRTRDAKGSRVLLDGAEASAVDIERVAGPTDKFLAVFCPGYITAMGDTKARAFLMSMVKRVDPKTVLEALPKPWPDVLRQVGTVGLVDPEGTAKELREQIKDEQQKIERCKGAIATLRDSLKQAVPDEEPSYEAEIEQVRSQMDELADLKPELQDISEIDQQINQLRTEYAAIAAKKRDLPPLKAGDTCPECGQTINADHAKQVTERIRVENAAIDKELDGISEQGKALAGKLNEVKAANQEAEQRYQMETGQQRVAMRERLNDLLSLQRESTHKNAIREALLRSKAEAQEKIQKNEADIEAHELAITESNSQITALKEYQAKAAELQVEQLTQHLNHVIIKLFDMVKSTGELKPVFGIQFDGKPYGSLSTSEKIRADLELSGLVNALTGFNFPVFLDNAESITSFDPPAQVQLFTATVVAGAELQVAVKEEAVA